MVTAVGTAIDSLLEKPDVDRIVFVYVNHGTVMGLGLPGSRPPLNLGDFVGWAGAARAANKPTLFVLECRRSEGFADFILNRLQGQCAI
jgi:hypothetical protein